MLKALSIAAAIAAGAPAFAADPPPAPPPPPVVRALPSAPPTAQPASDPAALAEARGLLRDIDFEGQMDRTAREGAERSFDTIMRETQASYGQEIPAELRARVHAILMEDVGRIVDEMRPTALDDAARIYARYFTAAELQEIRRIQTNPVIMKMQRLAPQFLPELMQIGVAASARHMPELMERVRQAVEQWEREQQARRPHVS